MHWLHKPAHRPLFVSLLVFALILAGLVTALQLSKVSQDTRTGALTDQIDLTLSPASISGLIGDQISVDVFMHQNNLQFAAATLHIYYQPMFIEFNDVRPGSGITLLHTATESGFLTISVGVECYPDNTCFSVTEAGYRIATLTFTATSIGQTPLTLTPDTQTAAKEAFAVDRTGSLSDSQIIIVSDVTPTSPPSPTNTPTTPAPTTPTPTVTSPPPPSDELGIVYGIVTDKITGDPIQNATVILKVPGVKGKPGELENTTTDTNGNYQLKALAGVYDIVYTAKGYKGYASTVTLRSGHLYRKDIALDPKNPKK